MPYHFLCVLANCDVVLYSIGTVAFERREPNIMRFFLTVCVFLIFVSFVKAGGADEIYDDLVTLSVEDLEKVVVLYSIVCAERGVELPPNALPLFYRFLNECEKKIAGRVEFSPADLANAIFTEHFRLAEDAIRVLRTFLHSRWHEVHQDFSSYIEMKGGGAGEADYFTYSMYSENLYFLSAVLSALNNEYHSVLSSWAEEENQTVHTVYVSVKTRGWSDWVFAGCFFAAAVCFFASSILRFKKGNTCS